MPQNTGCILTYKVINTTYDRRKLLTCNRELRVEVRDFPGGPVVKNPPASAGDTGWIPGLERHHMLQSN